MAEKQPNPARVRGGRRGRELAAERERVRLPEVHRLRWHGLVAASLKPMATQADQELADLIADKGDGVTAAERSLLEDHARLGLLLRAEFARFLETKDPDAARTVNSLASQRRANLAAVGLERRARPVTVGAIIETISAEKAAEAAQNRAGAPNGIGHDGEDQYA